MKSIASKIALISILISITNAAISAVIPFGVQSNVSETTVSDWGWSMCYSEAESGGADTLVSAIQGLCGNDYTAMSLFNLSTNTYDILAAGESRAVFMQTPEVFNTVLTDGFNQSNGVNWYLYDNLTSVWGGWGFFSQNSSVQPRHCDFNDQGNINKSSMCMHMRDINNSGDGDSSDDYIRDVYSIFNNGVMTYTSSNYEIRFFSIESTPSNQTNVSTPATFGLISLGLLILLYRRFTVKH